MDKKIILSFAYFLSCYSSIHAVNVTIHNTLPWIVWLTWEFSGDYWRKEVPAATDKAVGKKSIRDWRLHKGFSKVAITSAKVGEVWGKNPETGDDLVFTPNMVTTTGAVWGIKPDLYKSPGQAVYNNFRLTIVPKRNPKDNNNWWPSFDIARIDADVFAPLVKAFAPLKNFFDNIANYTPLAFKIIDALAQKRPITGFQLKRPAQYLNKSAQEYSPTIAQERIALVKARDALGVNDPQRTIYEDEIKVLDAIKKYSPILYLHPDDLAGPVAPADYFTNETAMVREKNTQQRNPVVIARGKVTFKKLQELAQQNPGKEYFIWHGLAESPLKYDKRIFYGSNPSLYPHGVPVFVTTFYEPELMQQVAQAIDSVLQATKAVQEATTANSKQLSQLTKTWNQTVAKSLKDLETTNPTWKQMLQDTLQPTAKETSLEHLTNLLKRARSNASTPKTNVFYIQWLLFYAYNQPYTISVAAGTIFQGDVKNFQNAHEGDLEHITMKINARTGDLLAVEYGAHGTTEGMWLYPPKTTDNPMNEFMTDNGHPIVFVAYGGHGNYPREGVYTRIFGLANDVTKKSSSVWPVTEQNTYRVVMPTSIGFNPLVHKINPDLMGFLEIKGDLGPRGADMPASQSWFASTQKLPKAESTRSPIGVHTAHFCPTLTTAGKTNPNTTVVDQNCLRTNNKQSPPPNQKKSALVEILQNIGIM